MAELPPIDIVSFFSKDRWKVIQTEKSFARLGHINPETRAHPEYSQSNKLIKSETRGNTVETISTVGIATKKGKLGDVYDGLEGMAAMGLLKGFTVADVKSLRSQTNEQMPEECDLWADVNIAQYVDENAARKALENIAENVEKGFADTQVPGATQGMTLKEAFKNPIVREHAKTSGVSSAQMDEALQRITEASEQAVEQYSKSGVKYEKGKFEGFDAMYIKPPSWNKPVADAGSAKNKRRTGKIEIRRADGSKIKITGGGGSDTRVKLPANAFAKENYPIDGHILNAVRAGRSVITGMLLMYINLLPTGKAFAQSLTRFKTITQTSREGGMTFIDRFIVPLNSTLEAEGYAHREEVADIIKRIASRLSSK